VVTYYFVHTFGVSLNEIVTSAKEGLFYIAFINLSVDRIAEEVTGEF